MNCCIYLRKSRSDRDTEEYLAQDPAATLERHEKILTELARSMNITVGAIYREVVSGDTVSSRPEVRRLLSEVERGMWDGVLVMEIERLARGDAVDQGIVARAFRYSQTKIITPLKIYDPLNDFDEEYFEFGLFMSRREYKTINRRLSLGRLSSAKEGKFAGSVAPYGYKSVKLRGQKGYSLEIIPSEAEIVKLIFSLYLSGIPGTSDLFPGAGAIAEYLSSLAVLSRKSTRWSASSVREILKNPVYIGKIRWNHRKTVKKIKDGNVYFSRPRSKNYLLTDGLHQPIISEDIFFKVQSRLGSYVPIPSEKLMKNPFSGIIICGYCGRKTVRKPMPDRKDILICPYCRQNASVRLELIEKAVISTLATKFDGYNIDIHVNPSVSPSTAGALKNSAACFEKRLERIYDLFERGIYSEDDFLKRRTALEKSIELAKANLKSISCSVSLPIDFSGSVAELYSAIPGAEGKNALLRTVFDRIVYTKSKKTAPDDFLLSFFSNLPPR